MMLTKPDYSTGSLNVSSPELVAKLGHDYTVYAYDYSEYETPLVGQGMLSWILASASATPNAPAEQSQTMVTGRVCKNILGLFSNGVKETLEVKLKLVPVPTCMQSEYVENMERYHNLSKVMPEGMDYNAWAEFLDANPAIRQLAQPTPGSNGQMSQRSYFGGVESFHEMLTRPSPTERNDPFHDQHRLSFSAHDTRASSPAMSTVSFHPYTFNQDSRPASRASVRSETASQAQYYPPAGHMGQDQQEEGPPKKRARITKAKRPKKAALLAGNESLRVTASTAASVRLHRPIAPNPGAAVSAEQVPRAPTPRPGDATLSQPQGPLRLPPSLLRHASMDENRPCPVPYDTSLFSDTAVDSADDERASPGETPLNIPSSPPAMPQRLASSAPSSPELPVLPLPNDSGFVSDIPTGREDNEADPNSRPCDGSDLPIASGTRRRAKQDRSSHPWINITQDQVLEQSQLPTVNASSLDSSLPPADANVDAAPRRSGTPNFPAQPFVPKARGLPRSHTWSGEPMSDAPTPAEDGRQPRSGAGANRRRLIGEKLEEPMSDAPTPAEDGRQPRSGAGANRRQIIREKLADALVKGEMPTYCNNCGQIDTPIWRRAYTRVEKGSPVGITISSNKSDITAFEIIEPGDDNDDQPRYRIFKQMLEPEEAESQTFTKLILCNPCGLWLKKNNAMRPHEIWAKPPSDKPKRKRNGKKAKGGAEEGMSDAIVPNSEPVIADSQVETEAPSLVDGTVDTGAQPSVQSRSASFQATAGYQLDEAAAQAALARAIQSSPVGLRGSKNSPIEVEADLTPKPTRRLLFPSPREPGEVKSLADTRSSESPSARASAPRQTESTQRLSVDAGDTDKENCPPPIDNEVDGLTHLFEDNVSPKTTPTKGRSLEDFLKTPTPGSRCRAPLTPKRGADQASLVTPSRLLKTPRTSGRATAIAPETPFTRQLNALLSDCLPTSPSQAIDLSTFHMFNTPGRNGFSSAQFTDFSMPDDFLSSDLPVPSSPPGGLGFSVFEDPNTSTVGLWSGASIFGSDAVISGIETGEAKEAERRGSAQPTLKMDGISVDFAAMIEQVVGASEDQTQSSEGRVKMPVVAMREESHEKTSGDKDKAPETSVGAEVGDVPGAANKASEEQEKGSKGKDKNPIAYIHTLPDQASVPGIQEQSTESLGQTPTAHPDDQKQESDDQARMPNCGSNDQTRRLGPKSEHPHAGSDVRTSNGRDKTLDAARRQAAEP